MSEPEKDLNLSIEQKIAAVDDWIAQFEFGNIGEIAPALLREVFAEHGATFELTLSEHQSLGRYSNEGKALGIRAVWRQHFDDYKDWTKAFVRDCEARTGKPLPALTKSGIKNSGMIQFLGEMTAYANGPITMGFQNYKEYTEARLHNGRAWAEGEKGDRIRVLVPTSAEPSLLSSVPPEFPKAAWEKIKSWRE